VQRLHLKNCHVSNVFNVCYFILTFSPKLLVFLRYAFSILAFNVPLGNELLQAVNITWHRKPHETVQRPCAEI